MHKLFSFIFQAILLAAFQAAAMAQTALRAEDAGQRESRPVARGRLRREGDAAGREYEGARQPDEREREYRGRRVRGRLEPDPG